MNRIRRLSTVVNVIFIVMFNTCGYNRVGSVDPESICKNKNTGSMDDSAMLVPHKLQKGDKVGMIALANPATNDRLDNAIKLLKNAGFVPIISTDMMVP